MNVSAIIVTRGDVDVQPILDSWPDEWQKLVWDNGSRKIRKWSWDQNVFAPHWNEDVSDLAVYGRYAAIEYASHDICFVQDDDCIVSDSQAIVDEWVRATETDEIEDSTWWPDSLVVCNMPTEFRHDFYVDHALVGFGAAFHRDAPEKAFTRFAEKPFKWPWPGDPFYLGDEQGRDLFLRTCDIVFTALTPRVLVDVPVEHLPWATDDSRMYRQPEHVGERARMLELARRAKGAA